MKLYHSNENLATASGVSVEQALLDLEIASIELTDLYEEGAQIQHAYELYSMIVDTIQKSGGVTKSLEAMFGENFTCADNMLVEASAEVFGWAEKAWNWVVQFCKKIWAWISSFWTSVDSVKAQLRALKEKSATIKYPFEVKKSGSLKKVEDANNALRKFIDTVNTANSAAELDSIAAIKLTEQEAIEKQEAATMTFASAADLNKEIDGILDQFSKIFAVREEFEKAQKKLSEDKFKPAEKPAAPADGQQPAQPADPNVGKFAALQGKLMQIGKLVQTYNKKLVVYSKIIIASAAESK